jgi:hypothetical protein
MVIVKLTGVPTQPFKVGVMETVPEMAAVVALVPVKGEILPDPLAPKPIAVFELVHVNDTQIKNRLVTLYY